MSSVPSMWLSCTLLGVIAACGLSGIGSKPPPAVTEITPALMERITVHLGCDETFVARNPESTAVLTVRVPGILTRSRGADLPYEEMLQVKEGAVVVLFEQGADLDHWCTDVMARPPRIDAAWIGVSGAATVTLKERRGHDRAAAGGARTQPTKAILRLGPTVVVREDDQGERLTLPAVEIVATVGEPAGG